MPTAPDISQYITPLLNLPQPDYTRAFAPAIQAKQWADQQSEQAAQFGQNQARLKAENAAQLGMQGRELESQNRRFAEQQSIALQEKAEDDARRRYDAATKLASDTRQMVAHGRYSEALANVGTLRDLGVDVNVSKNPQGEYLFHIGVPNYHGPEAKTDFASIYGNIATGQQNPFESLRGSSQAALGGQIGVKPEEPQTGTTQPPPEARPTAAFAGHPAAPPSLDPQNPFAALKGPGSDSPEPSAPQEQGVSAVPPMGSTAPQQATVPQPAAATQPGATPTGTPPVGDLNSGELARLNAAQMAPLMGGIVGSFSPRFQGRIGELMTGLSALHDTPEGTLTAGNPYFKTIVGNMNAELNAEAQAAKQSQSQSTAAMTDERQREEFATREAENVAKEQALQTDIQFSRDAAEVKRKVNSGDRVAQADAIKQLLGMRESKAAVSRDFKGFINQMASTPEQAQNLIEMAFKGQLPLSVREKINKAIDIEESSAKDRVKQSANQMWSYANSYRNEGERYATRRWVKGHIPAELQTEEMQKWTPMSDQGGNTPAITSSRQSSSSSGNFTAPVGDENLGVVPLPAAPRDANHPDSQIEDLLQ